MQEIGDQGTATVGELIVETLAAHDIDRIFCVPGESYLGLLEERLVAIEAAKSWSPRVENCLTEEVHGAPGVAEIIAPYPVAKSEAELKGVSKAMRVYRLARTAP